MTSEATESSTDLAYRLAVRYIDLGFAVMPIHGVNEDGSCRCSRPACPEGDVGKHPRGVRHGSTDATQDVEALRKWLDTGKLTGNVAAVMVKHVTIDVDGEIGAAALEMLSDQNGLILPPTLTQETGRGRHYVFSLPEGVKLKNSESLIAPKLDVRGNDSRGYIITAPSVHKTQTKYMWTTDLLRDDPVIAELPQEWIEAIQAAHDQPKPRKPPTTSPQAPAAIPAVEQPTAPKKQAWPPGFWTGEPPAKRAMAEDGPSIPGRKSFMHSCVVLAAIFARHGLEQSEAVEACRRMPFVPGKTSAKRVMADVPDFVEFAYRKQEQGEPIQTGCPRAAQRYGTSNTNVHYRDQFEGHCDAACAQTCPIFIGRVEPATILLKSKYSETLMATFWRMIPEVFETWKQLAAWSVSRGHDVVWANATYLFEYNGCTRDVRTYRLRLAELRKLKLIDTKNRKLGWHEVIVPTEQHLADIAAMLNVEERVEKNRKRQQAERERLDDFNASKRPQAVHAEE